MHAGAALLTGKALAPAAATLLRSIPKASVQRAPPSWPDVYEAMDVRASMRLAETYVAEVPPDAPPVLRAAAEDVRLQVEHTRNAIEALDEALERPHTWSGWLWSWIVAPHNLEVRYASVVRCNAVLEKRMERLLSVVRAPPPTKYKYVPVP